MDQLSAPPRTEDDIEQRRVQLEAPLCLLGERHGGDAAPASRSRDRATRRRTRAPAPDAMSAREGLWYLGSVVLGSAGLGMAVVLALGLAGQL